MKHIFKAYGPIISILLISASSYASSSSCDALLSGEKDKMVFKIQETVGTWHGGFSGMVSLPKPQAERIYELAIKYEKDPLQLAQELETRIKSKRSDSAADHVEGLATDLLAAKSGLDAKEIIPKIQEIVGKWHGGMSGVVSLNLKESRALFEVAVTYKQDPLRLAEELKAKIQSRRDGNPKNFIEEIRVDLLTVGSGLNQEETVSKIREVVGRWHAGMSGMVDLTEMEAQKLFEVAVTYKQDPIRLAKILKSKIHNDSWGNPLEMIEEIKTSLAAGN